MALAGGGPYTTSKVSQHALTNAQVIARFLPIDISFHSQKIFSVCHVKALANAEGRLL